MENERFVVVVPAVSVYEEAVVSSVTLVISIAVKKEFSFYQRLYQ
jgi:hypothetical protein